MRSLLRSSPRSSRSRSPDDPVRGLVGMMSSLAGKPPVALGAGMDAAMAADSLARYLSTPAFQAMDAVRNERAHSIWHYSYNSPFNIVATQAFAGRIHSTIFEDVTPQRTLQHIFDASCRSS